MFLYLNRINFRSGHLSNNVNFLVFLNKKIHSSYLLLNKDENNQNNVEINQNTNKSENIENVNTKKKKVFKFPLIDMEKRPDETIPTKSEIKIEIKKEINNKPTTIIKETLNDLKTDYKAEEKQFRVEKDSKEIKKTTKYIDFKKPEKILTKNPVKQSSHDDVLSKLIGNKTINYNEFKQQPKNTNTVKTEIISTKKPVKTYEEILTKLSDDKITRKLAGLIDRKNTEEIMETLRNPIENISKLRKEKAPEILKKERGLKTVSNDLKLNILDAIKKDSEEYGNGEISKTLKKYDFNQIQPKTKESIRVPYVKIDKTGSKDGNNYQKFHQLKEGEGLLIFSENQQKNADTTQESPIWKNHYEEQLKNIQEIPPLSGLEELIILTDQGKIWQFPIDNEQGVDETDAQTSFYEHIFLDRYLEEFSAIEPVQEFMTLVLNGLSQNSFLSVEEKKQIIQWYKEYFKEKEGLILESLEAERQEAAYRENLEILKSTKQN